MKTGMKKISLLCTTAEKEATLQKVGKYRSIHIDGSKEEYPVPREISSELEILEHIEKAIENALNKVGHQSKDPSLDVSFNPEAFKKKIDDIEKDIEELTDKMEDLKRHQKNLEPWGNIHWLKLGILNRFGVEVRFFTLPEKEFRVLEIPEGHIYTVNKDRGLIYFVVFEMGDRIQVDADEVHLQKKSLTAVLKEYEECQGAILEGWKSLARMEIFLRDLGRKRAGLLRNAQWHIASEKVEPVGDSGGIQYLTGWVPEKKLDKLRKKLDKDGFAYRISDPEIGDQVPILLKNNKYNSWFEDITKLYQLPNYREFDLTPFIGFFYPIFFAYCLGDAGYGIVLTILSLVGLRTIFKGNKAPGYLALVLGILTMFIGTVKSGTFFGISLLEAKNIPVLGYFERFVFITDDQDFMFNAFNVSLMVGLFQIILGVVISITRRAKFMSFGMALPQVGKLLIILSAVALFLGGNQDMAPFNQYTTPLTWILLSGVIIMIAFYDLSLPIGQRIGNGFLGVFFVFTGLLGDILSYIRLFALGVSSSILGLVVNQMASPMFEGSIIAIAGGVILLVIGHGLNFGIALLGSMIHPLRLTFVEFYNNAQFEGGGTEYEPFKN